MCLFAVIGERGMHSLKKWLKHSLLNILQFYLVLFLEYLSSGQSITYANTTTSIVMVSKVLLQLIYLHDVALQQIGRCSKMAEKRQFVAIY